MRHLIFRPLQEFLRLEAASGIVLLIFTLIAVGWANSPLADSYHTLWREPLAGMSTLDWVNDGLMSIFFLVVGLEIKREFMEGELSSRSKAALPIAAAFGGMVVPALIYWALNAKTSAASGWGVPMATDIAFALGVLTLLGKRVPSSLKVFLMALAIADDLGAVLVIALVYTQEVAWSFLVAGLGILGALLLLNKAGLRHATIYLLSGIAVWVCFLKSGVHPTIAGVLLAVVIPSATGHRLERVLHPWVAFVLMPLFALGNAGVSLVESTPFNRVGLGIILGLVIGKQVGITLFSWIAVRLRLAALPDGVSWSQIYGIACLGGIGFTMSIFIANLAFDSSLIDGAKVAVLTASVVSACVGALVLRRAT